MSKNTQGPPAIPTEALLTLIARYEGLGIEPDLHSMEPTEIWGLYLWLSRKA
jgi:hypothetical protein